MIQLSNFESNFELIPRWGA